MKNGPNHPNNTIVRPAGQQSVLKPTLHLVSSVLVHHKLIVLNVVAENNVGATPLPNQSTKLLFRTFSDDAEQRSIVKLDNNVCLCFLTELHLPLVIFLQSEEFDEVSVFLKLRFEQA